MNTSSRLLGLLALLLLAPAARADDWPGWLGAQRDSIWREKGVLDKFPKDGPKVRWRAPVAGGYSGPAVANGRVYVTDFVTKGDRTGDSVRRGRLTGKERVLCFRASDGKQLWSHEDDVNYHISYPGGPRTTPTVSGGKVYTLGAEGLLLCLDAAKGTKLWSRELTKDYKVNTPMWGFCGQPLVYGNKVVTLVGGPGTVAVAFDKDTGRELWRSLSATEPGYSAPILIEAGGKKQLIIWHSESVNGLDPETGKPYWSIPCAPAFAMSIMTPRKFGDYLFVSGMFNAGVLIKLAADRPAAEVVWRGKRDTALYAKNPTPFIDDGHIYGVCLFGELRCVNLATGKRLWEDFRPVAGKKAGSGTAFLVKNGDRFFIFSETGHLIIARLSPKGYQEISRAKILEPNSKAHGRDVAWSHPAFANRCVFARNDKELVCVSLAAE
jgi:outer membrane protein assembly factor BamB